MCIRDSNIIASIQPVHCISDMYMAEDRLGSRIDDAYLWATLLDNKIKIMGGSDFPVEDCSPLIGIHAAVNRQKINYLPVDGWKPKEKLNIKEAVNEPIKDYAPNSEEKRSLARAKWKSYKDLKCKISSHKVA